MFKWFDSNQPYLWWKIASMAEWEIVNLDPLKCATEPINKKVQRKTINHSDIYSPFNLVYLDTHASTLLKICDTYIYDNMHRYSYMQTYKCFVSF